VDSDDDDTLLARAAAGDRRAFSLLVTRHCERVRALALRFTGNGADADDVAQMVFTAAWRELPRWRPGQARFGTWLYRVTLNRCIDLGRRRKVRAWLSLDSVAEPADEAVGADDLADQRSELVAVRRDMLELPPKQRAALLLAAQAEKSTGEIAEALGVSEGAAEQLLVRARRTLRERMRDRMRADRRDGSVVGAQGAEAKEEKREGARRDAADVNRAEIRR
jgi:RNA polymerase sigma-70 factor (ECF subfamily)